MNDNLDKEILELFNKLDTDLKDEEKKLIHFKSVSNFIHHLIFNQTDNPKKNEELQRLGEVRLKKKLFEYLNLVSNKKVNTKESSILYRKYIDEIGDFMVDYYGFSGEGGKLKLLTLLIVVILGAIMDFIIYLFNSKVQYTFIALFLSLYFVRLFIKYKTKKLYGFFY